MPDDTVTPLASRDELMAIPGLTVLVRDMGVDQVDRLMTRATRAVEAKCDRRLAPFTITESTRAEGIDIAGQGDAGWPLDIIAALGKSKAQAYGGAGSLVRDVWLRQYAPVMADYWTYSGVSIALARAVGGLQTVQGATLEGPEPDTGHLRFSLGTYCPVGTTVRVTYSGGYTTVPDDLATATCFMAAKLAIRFAEPQTRKGMTVADLDDQIIDALASYIRS